MTKTETPFHAIDYAWDTPDRAAMLARLAPTTYIPTIPTTDTFLIDESTFAPLHVAQKRDAKKTKKSTDNMFKCMECGKKMTLAAANKAMFGLGCTKCGSSDIDLA